MSVTFTFEGCPEDLSINMANGNARYFFENLDIDLGDELCGELSVEQMDKMFKTVTVAIETKNYRPFTRESHTEGIITTCGLGKEYVENRLYDFKNLLLAAIMRNKQIRYA